MEPIYDGGSFDELFGLGGPRPWTRRSYFGGQGAEMSLQDWAAAVSLLAALGAFASLARIAFVLGKFYQRFENVENDAKESKADRVQMGKNVTTIMARCKLCYGEGD